MTLLYEMWQWALSREITLSAEHLPGVLNAIADRESRTIDNHDSECMLKHQIFGDLCSIFGSPDIDLFACWLNNQLQSYYAWKPDPGECIFSVMYWKIHIRISSFQTDHTIPQQGGTGGSRHLGNCPDVAHATMVANSPQHADSATLHPTATSADFAITVVRLMECSPDRVGIQIPGRTLRECAGASMAMAGVLTQEPWSLCLMPMRPDVLSGWVPTEQPWEWLWVGPEGRLRGICGTLPLELSVEIMCDLSSEQCVVTCEWRCHTWVFMGIGKGWIKR